LQADPERQPHLGGGRPELPDDQGHHLQQLHVPVLATRAEDGLPNQLQLLHRGLPKPVARSAEFERPGQARLTRRTCPGPSTTFRVPMKATVTVLTSLSLAVVCGCGVRAVPLNSDATFAMHQESRTFVVDRPSSGPPAEVTAAEFFRLPGDPAWAL